MSICTCPTECDCQDPDRGLLSNHCPEHNWRGGVPSPLPVEDCPQHGPDAIDYYTTPHRYEAIGTPGWRTCTYCGAGANARIHRVGVPA